MKTKAARLLIPGDTVFDSEDKPLKVLSVTKGILVNHVNILFDETGLWSEMPKNAQVKVVEAVSEA